MIQMKKLAIAAFALIGLAALFVGVRLLAGPTFDNILNRYPGSVRGGSERFSLESAYGGSISRQADYQTEDDFMTVKQWYDTHFGVAPAMDKNAMGDCAWLTKSNTTLRIAHTVSVMLCALPHGTRVFVNERVYLRR
jgi:hypothetical protein